MTSEDRYGSPNAVESAIASAARKAAAADSSLSIQERIRLEYFHRFLSRVFSEAEDGDWILKGGAGMLARVASARSTTDVDLFRRSLSLDEALADLRRLAAIDLGDFFRFDYTGHLVVIDGVRQAAAEGYQVTFDISIGAKKKESFHVDLVVNVVATDGIEVAPPANALDLPKLRSHPYRLYPVVDQIADKVCATIALYSGRPSSREKDLVDLVVLAVTQDVDSTKLRRALTSEANVRSLVLPSAFEIPVTWGTRYARLAATVPACRNYSTVGAARALMTSFLDPVLGRGVAGRTWDHTQLDWL